MFEIALRKCAWKILLNASIIVSQFFFDISWNFRKIFTFPTICCSTKCWDFRKFPKKTLLPRRRTQQVATAVRLRTYKICTSNKIRQLQQQQRQKVQQSIASRPAPRCTERYVGAPRRISHLQTIVEHLVACSAWLGSTVRQLQVLGDIYTHID